MKKLYFASTCLVLLSGGYLMQGCHDRTNSDGSAQLTITDHWFFMGNPKDLVSASYIRSEPSVVREGEVFGIRVKFDPIKKRMPMHVRLRVPHSPERYPAHDGIAAISTDKKSVLVDSWIEGSDGTASYYWEVGKGDPKGDYQLTFSLDWKEIDTYKFTVN